VDFRKAYDSICRKRLILKLKEIGLSGKILRTIEVMYSSPKLSLVSRGHLSEPFEATVGLKQGDVLSTLLFNLFINDLPKELSKKHKVNDVDIPTLADTKINSLLFADDLAII